MDDRQTKKHRLTAADAITLTRIVCIVPLLFVRVPSPAFFILYSLAGITDVLDGTVARMTKTASHFGAKLDSIADLLFYATMLYRFFPILWQRLPALLWYGVAFVLLVRTAAYLTAALRFGRFASIHTVPNKLTGAAVFFLPYVLALTNGIIYAWIVCALGLISSVEELLIHLLQAEYDPQVRSVLQLCRRK